MTMKSTPAMPKPVMVAARSSELAITSSAQRGTGEAEIAEDQGANVTLRYVVTASAASLLTSPILIWIPPPLRMASTCTVAPRRCW